MPIVFQKILERVSQRGVDSLLGYMIEVLYVIDGGDHYCLFFVYIN